MPFLPTMLLLGAWGDGSVLTSICCSCKRPGFGSQHLENGLQPAVSPAVGDSVTSSCPQGNSVGSGIKFRTSGLEAGALPRKPSHETLALCFLIPPLYTTINSAYSPWMSMQEVCDLTFCSYMHRRM